MKIIPLADRGNYKAREVIRAIAQTPPANSPLNYDEIGKRVKILELLDDQEGELFRLEDADWQVLSRAVDTFPFGVAHPDLYAIAKAIKEAKDVPIQSVKERA